MSAPANANDQVERGNPTAPIARIDALYTRLNRRFRRARMSDFLQTTSLIAHNRVLDVGGTPEIWSLLPFRPHLTMLNLTPSSGVGAAIQVVGDGRRLPFRDNSFDIVFSNSVIEHVGSAESQRQFAQEIGRVGRSYYVQTPNRWFPLEPHLLTPLIHFLPREWRRKLIRHFTVWGLLTRPSPEVVHEFVASTRLLDSRDMRFFFASGQIRRERFVGLTKSLVAYGPAVPRAISGP